MPSLVNIFHLGIKELWSLIRDPAMVLLILYTFTAAIYIGATAMPETLYLAPVAIVDEDRSPLSERIQLALYPPHFSTPIAVDMAAADAGMDAGRYSFVIDLPEHLQRDLIAGQQPTIQLNVDATRMSQAFSGAGYLEQIIQGEIAEFMQGHRATNRPPVTLALRARFNPNLTPAWFGAVIKLIDNVTMLSIILAGAALIREREHGTIEHLLVMPITPVEIMLAKIWSMALVVLLATAASLFFIVQYAIGVPIHGSIALFLFCAGLHLLATTSLAIFMATIARSMPQFGMLMVLTLLPLQMLSGGMTPRESMPVLVQTLMQVAPTTHFVSAAQGILFRGADFSMIWPHCAALLVISLMLFSISLLRFRKTISLMA